MQLSNLAVIILFWSVKVVFYFELLYFFLTQMITDSSRSVLPSLLDMYLSFIKDKMTNLAFKVSYFITSGVLKDPVLTIMLHAPLLLSLVCTGARLLVFSGVLLFLRQAFNCVERNYYA